MGNCTLCEGASQALQGVLRAARGGFGQLPEHVVDALVDLKLWGVYAYLDLLAGRSGWLKATAANLAARTDRSAGTFGARCGALERAGLILIEPAGRARIYRTARRRGERFGRLPASLVAATGRVELWGLYAWLDLLAGGEGTLRMSYQDLAADLGLARGRVNRLLLDLEALNAIALVGHGDSRLIDLVPAAQSCSCAATRGDAPSSLRTRSLRVLPGDAGAPPVGAVLDPEWSPNERGSQRAGPPLLNSGSHNNPTDRHPDLSRHNVDDGEGDLLAACLEAWLEVIGPVSDLVATRVERHVRSGHGQDLLKAIGWCVGREVRTWRFVERVLWTRGWEQPPPGTAGRERRRAGSEAPGAGAAAIDALTLTQ